MKKIPFIFFLLLILSCATQKNYYLKSSDFKGKKIVFYLKEGSSYKKVHKFGEHIGNSKDPNIHEVLRESVQELSEETKIDMTYSPNFVFPNDSIAPVIVNIKKIDWIFLETKSIMNVDIEYIVNGNRIINVIGVHKYKFFVAGTKSANLRKSLKDGHKQLLSAI